MMQHGRLFSRWRCITHKTGSYNYNLMSRHEFEACDIVSDVTVGIVKPKTYGGVNGDISRNSYPDWVELCRFKENQKKIFSAWGKFIEKKRVEIYKYRKNKIANKPNRLLRN